MQVFVWVYFLDIAKWPQISIVYKSVNQSYSQPCVCFLTEITKYIQLCLRSRLLTCKYLSVLTASQRSGHSDTEPP